MISVLLRTVWPKMELAQRPAAAARPEGRGRYQMNPLDLDQGFDPCPVEDGDELFANGIFVFNVTRILESIERDSAEVALVHVAVSSLRWGHRSLDETQVESADIARPVVLAEIAPGDYNLIDGHHRVEKAHRCGVNTLQAYVLTAGQHKRFLTSTRAYLAYVGYWNDKVRERRGAAEGPPAFGEAKWGWDAECLDVSACDG